MKKILNKGFILFLNGIVILLPITITILLVRFFVIKLNSVVLNPILNILDPIGSDIKNVKIAKTAILISVFGGITFIGWAGRVLFINRIFSLGESILIKVPILGRIYIAIKQISSAFLGRGKTIFQKVVLVEYPRKGIYSMGFTTGVTSGEVGEFTNRKDVNVFIPTTPNPTTGMFIVIPEENVKYLKMNVEEGMKMIISGGSVVP